MKLLALDTATEACSAALLVGDELAARYEEVGHGHAERILPMIDELLAGAGLALRDLDAIAFGRGPGGFTGVRLAASITQGLAFGAGLPVLPVSTLQAVAERALARYRDAEHVLVANDARMKEVYWAVYACSASNASNASGASGVEAAVLVGAEHVGMPDPSALGPLKSAIGAGRGFTAYPAFRAAFDATLSAFEPELLPRAEEIVRIAARDFAAGRAVAPELAVPVYLRDDVAKPASRG